MTCREKLKMEHPEYVNDVYAGGCDWCPHMYGYLERPGYCEHKEDRDRCTKCWDREIPEFKKDTYTLELTQKELMELNYAVSLYFIELLENNSVQGSSVKSIMLKMRKALKDGDTNVK